MSLSVDIGEDQDFTYTLTSRKGVVYGGFGDTDTPSAEIWAGQDQTVLFAPTTAWIDPTAGTISVSITADQSATLAPGRYYCRVRVTRANDSRVFSGPDFVVRFVASPGSATTPSTYCQLEDLLLYASWIEELDSSEDQARLQQHCHLAREWIESVIQNSARVGNTGPLNILSWANSWYVAVFTDNKYLQSLLDSNYLMIQPKLVEICAKRTLGTYCMSKVGPGEKISPFQRMGEKWLRESGELIKAYKAQIDINGDGYPDVVIDCGRMTQRSNA